MKIVKKIKTGINDILCTWSVAGLFKIHEIVFVPRFGTQKTLEKRQERKLTAIMNILRKKYSNIINGYIDIEKKYSFTENAPIWVCWWQGENDMPMIVKICYNSLCKNASNHPVYLITKYNINQYINIPSYIMEKVQKGYISFTHLSDVIRMCLLYKHGGLWIDSTVYVSQPINEETFQVPIYSIATHKHIIGNISYCRWSTFLIGGMKGGLLFDFSRSFFLEYWKKEKRSLDYFLLDYIIALAYEHYPTIARYFDSLPTTHVRINEMTSILNQVYDENIFKELCEQQTFHKLSYKYPYYIQNREEKETLYGYLLRSLNPK